MIRTGFGGSGLGYALQGGTREQGESARKHWRSQEEETEFWRMDCTGCGDRKGEAPEGKGFSLWPLSLSLFILPLADLSGSTGNGLLSDKAACAQLPLPGWAGEAQRLPTPLRHTFLCFQFRLPPSCLASIPCIAATTLLSSVTKAQPPP